MISSFVDTHCHLNFQDFSTDVEHVIHAAQERGIHTILSICTKIDEMKDILPIVQKYGNIFATVGIHPHEAEATLKDFNISI